MSRCTGCCQTFQSAPGFITPGNAVTSGGTRRPGTVSIRPGVHHPGEHRGRPVHLVTGREFQSAPGFITPGNQNSHVGTRQSAVSIRPGVHHPGERSAVSVSTRAPRFQSAPGFITPGNQIAGRGRRPAVGFQSAPGFITPGNVGGAVLRADEGGFNPPRGSSPRGTGCPGRTGRHHGVSIRPGVHHPGEHDQDGVLDVRAAGFNPPRGSSPRGTRSKHVSPYDRMFQSAPGFITPGNRRDEPRVGRGRAVSIRPGVHHPGERQRPGIETKVYCFNPPRGSSPRGTQRRLAGG